MTQRDIITAERLREILHYDPKTGVFTWKNRPAREANPWNAKYAGKIAGSVAARGNVDITISIDGKLRHYKAHRLAWLYMTGGWPAHTIDHRDGIPTNNRFENLREATYAEQAQNYRLRADSSSGHPGVCFHKPSDKWMAHINGKYLGLFFTKEQAAFAYRKAKAERHAFQPVLRETAITDK